VNGCEDWLDIPSAKKLAAFCAIGGSAERHRSGFAIKLDGASFVAGLAGRTGPFTVGSFLEGALAKMLTKNEVSGKSERSGKGHGRALGGGG
jgi:hypothetical protein